MAIQEHVQCDLCGSCEYSVIWDKAIRYREGLISEEHRLIFDQASGEVLNARNVMCNKCGLVHINPRMSEAALHDWYKESYRATYGIDLRGEELHAQYALKYLAGKGILPGKGRYLDVGCSTGVLVEAIGKVGFSPYGIEQSEETAHIAQSKGLSVELGCVEEYKSAPFQLITILNTLEHMYSPRKVLDKLWTLLDDEGVLLIIVPDLCNNNIMITVDGFLSNAHLYTFDLYTIIQYARVTGYSIVCIDKQSEFNMSKFYIILRKGKVRDLLIDYHPDINQKRSLLLAADTIMSEQMKMLQYFKDTKVK